MSAAAAVAGVTIAAVSVLVAYREYRLAELRRLADLFAESRFVERFRRIRVVVLEYEERVMLWPNPEWGGLDVWSCEDSAEEPPRLKAQIGRLRADDPRFVELTRDALGPGFTSELRSDFADFYSLVRRVAGWIGLYRALRGDYWADSPGRERRSALGKRLYKALTRDRIRTWDHTLQAMLDFLGLWGRRLGWNKRRRARRVLEVLGLEFVEAVKDHRLVASRLFWGSMEDAGRHAAWHPMPGYQCDQEAVFSDYGLYDYGYDWLTTALWEVGSSQPEMLGDVFFNLRDLEHERLLRKNRDSEPWIDYSRRSD